MLGYVFHIDLFHFYYFRFQDSMPLFLYEMFEYHL